MGQQYGQQVLQGETGSATESIHIGPGEFLSLEISAITSATVEITAGLNDLTPIGLKNALTDVVEADASAVGLWYAFISPYTKVEVSATSLTSGDEIWVGVK